MLGPLSSCGPAERRPRRLTLDNGLLIDAATTSAPRRGGARSAAASQVRKRSEVRMAVEDRAARTLARRLPPLLHLPPHDLRRELRDRPVDLGASLVGLQLGRGELPDVR